MKAVDSFGGGGGAGGFGIVSGMKRIGAIAAVGLAAVGLAGCGSTSIDDLARARLGDGAGSCKPAAMISLGKVYSCQDGKGGTVCVSRDGDDLFFLEPEEYRITC